MKNVLAKTQIFTNASMNGNLTSSVTPISFLDNICIQLNFTGTPTGNFFVQGSVDYQTDYLGNVISTGNWISLTLVPSPVASGSANQILLDMNQLSFPYIRVIYTYSSGSGTLNGFIGGKSV